MHNVAKPQSSRETALRAGLPAAEIIRRIDEIRAGGDPWVAFHALEPLRAEFIRLDDLINKPHTDDWFEAVRLEAAHQVERWGVEHDNGKGPPEWFWLIGYLAGKAVASEIEGDADKAMHHTISSGAVLLNWWRSLRGIETLYQPGSDRAVKMVDR
jgi:hypothetical protein